MIKEGFQGGLQSSCLFAGETAQAWKTIGLDPHLASDAPLTGRSHRYEVAFAKRRLYISQPLRIGGSGSIDHQQADEKIVPTWLNRQAVPRENVVCSWMV